VAAGDVLPNWDRYTRALAAPDPHAKPRPGAPAPRLLRWVGRVRRSFCASLLCGVRDV